MIKEWWPERDDDRPARVAELMGPARSAQRETGGTGGATQVEMNPAIQKGVHLGSLYLTLPEAVNGEVIARC
jgi:hypothetical protein